MDDLVAWLGEQYDDEERVARKAGAEESSWRLDGTASTGPKLIVGDDDGAFWMREVIHEVWICDDEMDGCPELARGWIAEGEHIALHDPARVLAEVAAKRKILAAHQPSGGDCRVCCGEPYREEHWDGEEETTTWHRADVSWPCLTVRALAEPHAGRPGWRPEWVTG